MCSECEVARIANLKNAIFRDERGKYDIKQYQKNREN